MNKNKIINYLEKLLLLNFSIFLIFAPYEHKYTGKACMLIGIMSWLLINIFKHKYRFYREIIPVNPLNKSFLFFGAACLLSIIFSYNPYHSQGIFFDRYLLYFIFFSLGGWLITISKRNLYILVFVFILSSFIFGLGGVHDYFHYSRVNPVLAERIWSVFGRRIPFYGFPLYLVYFIPFVFSLTIFTKNKWLRISSFIIVVLLSLCLIWSVSRAAWVAITVSLIWIGLLKNKQTTYLLVLILALLITLAFIVPSTPKNIKERIGTTLVPSEWSFRLPLYNSAIAIFRDYPIWGSGIGNFEKLLHTPKYELPPDYPVPKELNLHAHNTYLEIAAEMGIIGFSTFILIFITFFKQVFRLIKYLDSNNLIDDKTIFIGLAGTILAILIFAFSTSIITVGVNNSAYFWFLFGMASGFLKRNKIELGK